ncbi:hypothetical protein Acid345_0740 [Candidatus Koribacter versatilis Ellin345]|uniref:Glycosyltransferase RgtA/B/C/D-like domain-containing protein n=1 Tax=Koribacter versatilis (strain Ellin345) TaxID=204669 RepID=Q1ITQ5_KORVE|nr:hypothetical protein [Candidatus Koribacter versatilis]ABF39745.1 hypothetical protein Acid345_0740 [Candidatus Koribacter versatilis Ellin345]
MADPNTNGSSWKILRTIALIGLFAVAIGRTALFPAWARIDEVWGHLATGRWILAQHAIPRSCVLSQYVNVPWIDTNWAFDAVLGIGYKLLSLRAVTVVGMALKLALTAMAFLLAGGRRKFWFALVIAAVMQFVFPEFVAAPINVAIVCFGIELALLFHWRRTHDARQLYALPVLFAVWCNFQIQFVLGLIVLALFVGGEAVRNRLEHAEVPLRPLMLASVGAGVATVLNPYGFYLAPQIFPTLYGSAAFKYFGELRPLGFRQPQDYLILVLVMGAFLALGRRRSKDIFSFAVLTLAACLGFRIQRDVWLVAVAAIAVLGDTVSDDQISEVGANANSVWHKPVVVGATAALFILFAAIAPNDKRIMALASESMPVKACDLVRGQNLRGPLFNSLEWGGFIRWYLPEQPVSIDGRANLYGDEMIREYLTTYFGGRRLESAPLFADAQTIVIAKNSALRRALTTFPDLTERYQEIYTDNFASVVVKK